MEAIASVVTGEIRSWGSRNCGVAKILGSTRESWLFSRARDVVENTMQTSIEHSSFSSPFALRPKRNDWTVLMVRDLAANGNSSVCLLILIAFNLTGMRISAAAP